MAASETIRGIQDQHVIATAKHYILQEQEHFRDQAWGTRDAVSSNVDDRTLHELSVAHAQEAPCGQANGLPGICGHSQNLFGPVWLV